MLDGIEIILRWKKESKTGLYQGNIQCGTIFAILIIISRYLITLKNINLFFAQAQSGESRSTALIVENSV
jgi:hypothetical protein